MTLRLRNLTDEDAEFMVNIWSIQERLEGFSLPKDQDKMLDYIHDVNTKQYDGKYYELFGIETQDLLVGILNFYQLNEDDVIIGISIDRRCWRMGYAYEAMQLAFTMLSEKGYHHVVSNCRVDNTASIALHKKCRRGS